MFTAKHGAGGVFLRGNKWYIHYSAGGKQHRETSGSTDRAVAEQLLQRRLAQNDAFLRDYEIRDISRGAALNLSREASRANIGAIAELIVSIDLLNKGMFVYRSVSTNAPCDLVVIDPLEPTKPMRYEVKTADERGTARRLRPEKAGRFDVLALVSRQGKIEYIKSDSPRLAEVCSRRSRILLSQSISPET